ncbi:tetratricopeptide repeat protein [Candidatus Acetothermia bacterium]|nr:tetratricopeptide repeat protein [Candidatus Acetothermia bacterium]MBI3643672.1 tetratricopeptide repeat protein [Candidatus Acetothermia bacterium]
MFHTLLFIGFSLQDEHFGLQLKAVSEIYKGSNGPHYVLVRESQSDEIKRLNLLSLEVVTFEDFGVPQIELLGELAQYAKNSKTTPSTSKDEEKKKTVESEIKYDRKNRIVHIPFRQKGDQVIGRDTSLAKVRDQLTSGKPTAIGQTAIFQGLGGLGKTQLAVEYAHRFKDEYPNGVIWLNADQDIAAQLVGIAEEARWIAPLSEHKDKLSIAIHRLRSFSECLVVFDNLVELKDIEPYLPTTEANPHILVTGRNEQPGFISVPIDKLNPKDSYKLLTQEVGKEPISEEEKKAVDEIIEKLDGLPLALEIAGAFVRYRQLNWTEYAGLLETSLKIALPPQFLKGSFTKHDKDLYSTLKVSEKILEEEPKLAEILNLLTWSGSAPMGFPLMKDLIIHEDEAKLRNALSLGASLRLLQKHPDKESYAIHRLVQEVRREDLPLQKNKDWVNEVCKKSADWFQERREEYSELSNFEAEADHLRAWLDHSLELSLDHSCRLMWLQAYPPFHRGQYKDAMDWSKKAEEMYQANNMKDELIKAHLFNDMGVLKSELGDVRGSLEYKEQALRIRLNALGQNHADTAMALSNVGLTYGRLGDHKKELDFEAKALDIRRELLGEKHPDTATSLSNVGVTYGSLGDHKKALEFKEKALEIRRELFGEKHPDTAQSLSNVGSTYGELGDHKKALEYQEKALEIRRELLGEKHPDTATSLSNVGVTYGSLGDHKKALEYGEKALEIRRELFGEKHPDTTTSLSNVGSTYGELGDHKKALEYQEKALEITREALGEKHPRTATLLNNVGSTYGELGDHKKALEYQEKALEIAREVLGEKHPSTATSLNNVGWTYRALGDNKKALEYGEKALEIRREVLGEKHPDTIRSAILVASNLFTQNRGPMAVNLLDRFLKVVERDHPGYASLVEAREEIRSNTPGFRRTYGKSSQGSKKKRKE